MFVLIKNDPTVDISMETFNRGVVVITTAQYHPTKP